MIVEKDACGREKRRELGWAMQEHDALAYAEKHGKTLEKVPGSEEQRMPLSTGEGLMTNLGTKR